MDEADKQTIKAFVSELDELDVGWSITDRSSVAGVLRDLAEGPTVAVPSVTDAVSLPDEWSTGLSEEALRTAGTGITRARVAIASYGSVVLDDAEPETELVSLYPKVHVAVVQASDVVPTMGDALSRLGDAFRDESASAIIATGPSATADMGALVCGAHGPMETHVVIVEESV